MSEIRHKTGIEWTHMPGRIGATWNPIVGCSPAPGSEKGGCLNCYARVLHDRRYKANKRVAELPAEMKLPYPQQYNFPFAAVRQMPHKLDEPLRWRKPHAVFVGSMTDPFHDDVPDNYLDRVFATMALTCHVFMLLTKRPERMREYLTNARVRIGTVATLLGLAAGRFKQPIEVSWPLSNVWLGTSVEDQATADARIPLLLDTPAAVRFISAEPLLGPVDAEVALGESCWDCDGDGHIHGYDSDGNDTEDCLDAPTCKCCGGNGRHDAVDWVIVGGESGPGHRPMDPAWARSVRDQCADAGVAYFYKQHGGPKSTHGDMLDDVLHHDWPM